MAGNTEIEVDAELVKALAMSLGEEEEENSLMTKELEENYALAHERIPQSMFPISMLYVPVYLNGHCIHAFIDTGAQISIINQTTAAICDIEKLILPMNIVLAGVGTQKALGKVMYAELQVGSGLLEWGFTVVLDGPSMILGLDIMKQYGFDIDLTNKKLLIKSIGIEVSFLKDNEINDDSLIGNCSTRK